MTYKDIINKYPLTCRNLKYIECGEGWLPLVNDVCRIIEHHIAILPKEEQEKVTATQIKSKFGELRFYMTLPSLPYIRGIIDLAEIISRRTCEECGAFARSCEINHWIWTLCEEHENAKRAARK